MYVWKYKSQFRKRYGQRLIVHVWLLLIWLVVIKASGCVHHDDVIKWKHFSCYWPFVRGIPRSPVDSSYKGQWCGALMFSLICALTSSWAHNQDAGDLRRHRAHYDVTVMLSNKELNVSTWCVLYGKSQAVYGCVYMCIGETGLYWYLHTYKQYMYIYIYIEREREREGVRYEPPVVAKPPVVSQPPVVGHTNRCLQGHTDDMSAPTCKLFGFNRNMIMTASIEIVQAIQNVFSTPHSKHCVKFDYLNSLRIPAVCVSVPSYRMVPTDI